MKVVVHACRNWCHTAMQTKANVATVALFRLGFFRLLGQSGGGAESAPSSTLSYDNET